MLLTPTLSVRTDSFALAASDYSHPDDDDDDDDDDDYDDIDVDDDDGNITCTSLLSLLQASSTQTAHL